MFVFPSVLFVVQHEERQTCLKISAIICRDSLLERVEEDQERFRLPMFTWKSAVKTEGARLGSSVSEPVESGPCVIIVGGGIHSVSAHWHLLLLCCAARPFT